MKVKVDSLPEGVIVCHISDALDRTEITTMVQVIEKLLSNGKARLILALSAKAIVDRIGIKQLEKNLRTHQALARKMGGDVLFVVPPSFVGQLPNSMGDLPLAIQHILKKPEPSAFPGVAQPEAKSDEDPAARIKVLELENRAMSAKIQDLLAAVRKPSTNEELKQAVEFYRNLALETEKQSPNAPPAAKK